VDKQETTRPIDAAERGAVARLLEQAAAALAADVPDDRAPVLFGTLQHALRRGATDIRRGHRSGDLDTVTGELRRLVAELTEGGDAA